MRRRILFWTPILLVILFPFTGCLTFDGSVLYHPARYPEGRWESADRKFEDVWFDSSDGTRLHGWFAEANQPRAILLHMHGNAGNVTHRAGLLELFRHQLRVSILVFDYRGYGRSDGEPGEKGILADARTARRWLAQRTGVAESQIVLHGTSLGGGVAVDLAARDGAKALILESTFTSVADAASHHAPLLPVRRVLKTRLDSLAKIGDYHGPLLQTHGDADTTIPFALGQRLFEAANEPKRFVRVPGGGHNDPPSDAYLSALDEFLTGLPAQ